MSAEYVDAAAILSGNFHPPKPTRGGKRSDGLHLLYPGSVNGLVGDPETGKTLIATACAADELYQGGSVLWLDLDHNGPSATLTRFRRYGIPAEWLCDPARFRLAIPEDAAGLLSIIADAPAWRPTVSVLDSVGEMLPMFGASSNSADEYTAVNQQTLVKLARGGSAVLGLDHMAKGTDSRAFGAGGTVAKKRAIDGAYLRVSTESGFSRGSGGRADLSIIKDRHGALREASESGKEPRVAVFEMSEWEGATNWTFSVPAAVVRAPKISDAERLRDLDPAPQSVRDVAERMAWGTHRASAALRDFRAIPSVAGVTATLLGTGGNGVAPLLPPLGGATSNNPGIVAQAVA
ncbi:MAG: hypothetical protein ACQEWM_06010 [Actinomycetota bacterium]